MKGVNHKEVSYIGHPIDWYSPQRSSMFCDLLKMKI